MVGAGQVKVDPDSQRLLEGLARQLGWDPARVVGEALQLLAACHGHSRRKMGGVGKFHSRVHDLGSNKANLKNFGR